LQILDDGVLTSGRGDRVYFSESFIIFTSNLGIYSNTANGERVQTVSADDSFEVVRARVRSEIERHFKLALGRPEILNRIGENIIVFDFIRESTANEIFDHMLKGILDDLTGTQGISVTLTADVLATIRLLCLADLSNGGRGIRNKLEVHLINPLARALFDANVRQGDCVAVDNVEFGEVTSLAISRREAAQL
jgi:ATP-dependent Clp protease ATP-binding subunit ClpA